MSYANYSLGDSTKKTLFVFSCQHELIKKKFTYQTIYLVYFLTLRSEAAWTESSF